MPGRLHGPHGPEEHSERAICRIADARVQEGAVMVVTPDASRADEAVPPSLARVVRIAVVAIRIQYSLRGGQRDEAWFSPRIRTH